jgi:hypothetical protein
VTFFFCRVDDGDGGFDLVVPSPLGSGSKLRRLLGVGPDSAELWVNLGIDSRPRETHPALTLNSEMRLIFNVEIGSEVEQCREINFYV